jgi:hypothetical protein
VNRRVIFLHTTIVTSPKKRSILVKEGCTNRDPTFGQPSPCFFQGDIEQGLVIKIRFHL